MPTAVPPLCCSCPAPGIAPGFLRLLPGSGMGNGGCCLCCSFFPMRGMLHTPPLLQRGVPPIGEVFLFQVLHALSLCGSLPQGQSFWNRQLQRGLLFPRVLPGSCSSPGPHSLLRAPPWAAGGFLLPCSPPRYQNRATQSQYRGETWDINKG